VQPWVKDEALRWVCAHSSALWCLVGEGQAQPRQRRGAASPPHGVAPASEGWGAAALVSAIKTAPTIASPCARGCSPLVLALQYGFSFGSRVTPRAKRWRLTQAGKNFCM